MQTVSRTEFDVAPGSGLNAATTLRLGARDGLSYEARLDFSLFRSELEFSNFYSQVNIPMSYRAGLILRGGGGTIGSGFAEGGVRVRAQGNGGPGSFFWELTAGGTGATRSHCEEALPNDRFGFTGCRTVGETEYVGLLVGAGIDVRF